MKEPDDGDNNNNGGILRRAGSGPLAVSAAVLFALAAAVLVAFPHKAFPSDPGAAAVVCGVASAALATAGSACLAERARRRGKPFHSAMGRALMAVSAISLFVLATAAAWMTWRLVAVGAPAGYWWAFLESVDLPPIEFPAALLPVGACLALGRRGRATVYAASALIAMAGFALLVRFGMMAHTMELVITSGSNLIPVPCTPAAQAVAGFMGGRLLAMAFGLAVALWMELSARNARFE